MRIFTRHVQILTLSITLLVASLLPSFAADVAYDLSRDFDKDQNPTGAWTLGWKSSLQDTLHVYTVPKAVPSQEGLPIDTWSSGPETAQVQHNGNSVTVTTSGTAGVFPPGTVILSPGHEFNPDIYSVARLTIPSGGDGTYRIQVAVRSYLNGPISGDTDFHILKNDVEIFGEFLPGNGTAAYSNTVALTAGDRLDFICGNGADGLNYASALVFSGTVSFVEMTRLDRLVALIALIDESDLSRRSKQGLISTLKSAIAAFREDRTIPALNELNALQHKISVQVARLNPALADTLIQAIQQIVANE